MKVCVISGYPPNIGRGAESTSIMIKELAKHDEISKLFVVANKHEDLSYRHIDKKVDVHRVWDAGSWLAPYKIVKQILKIKPDVVHFIYGYLFYGGIISSFFSTLYILCVLRLHSIPVVTTINQIFSFKEITDSFKKTFGSNIPKPVLKAGFYIINKIIGGLSNRIIALHKKYVLILKEYGITNTVYLPIGFKLPEGDSITQIVSADSPCSSTREILVFGFIFPKKGIEYVIGAMPKILKKYPDTHLAIHGSPLPSMADNKQLKQYINDLKESALEKGANTIVFNWNYMTEEHLAETLITTNVLILPNIKQSGPSEILRLGAVFGLPIITTNIDYFKKDVVHGQTGLLVPPADADAIADAVIRIFDSPTLRKRLSKGAMKWADEFKIENTAEKLIALYCDVK